MKVLETADALAKMVLRSETSQEMHDAALKLMMEVQEARQGVPVHVGGNVGSILLRNRHYERYRALAMSGDKDERHLAIKNARQDYNLSLHDAMDLVNAVVQRGCD